METCISVTVDQIGAYGRQIVRGAAAYANTHTRWSLRVENPQEMSVSIGKGAISGVIAQFGGVPAHAAATDPNATLLRVGIPTVNVSGRLEKSPFPRVANDDDAIGRMVAEYFLARGFRCFGYAGMATFFSWRRGEAFMATVRAAGHLSCAVNHSRHPLPSLPHDDWLRDLPKPCAVMGADDNIGKNLIVTCARVGLAVPEDIAVVGVENDPMLCELGGVPLSSVQSGAEKVGYEAARLLDGLMRGNPPPPHDILIPPQAVVTRRSSDILATHDTHVATALRHINANAHKLLRPAEILALIPLSRRMLELRFKRAVGRTIGAEILRVRMERAKCLLAESDLQIGEVAAAAGFGEPRYMNVAFRQLMHTTPKAYRRQHLLV